MAQLIGHNLGPYTLEQRIGEGGMAVVYRAYQPIAQRHVALKILAPHFASDPQFVARFVREARTLSKLQHPHLLPAYDFGQADGHLYLALKLVAGGTLATAMAQAPMPFERITTLIDEIAGALDFAHAHGIVHRDVKPSNILLEPDGHSYLSDFGLVKLLEASRQLTNTSGILGTPTYMSPEQCLGQPLDGRSDIYALGVILYELVAGRPPFSAETPMAVVVKQIYDPLPLPRSLNPDIPDALERVILKALAKQKEDRFATATELARALRAATGASPRRRSPVRFPTLPWWPRLYPGKTRPLIEPAAPPAPAAAQPSRGPFLLRTNGLVAGILLIVLLYGPLLKLAVSPLMPSGGEPPFDANVLLAFILTTGLTGLAGWLAGRRGGSPAECAWWGAVTGGIAGLVAFSGLAAPIVGAVAAAPMMRALPGPVASETEFTALIVDVVGQMMWLMPATWLASVLGGAAIGALGGRLGYTAGRTTAGTPFDERWWRRIAGGGLSALLVEVVVVVVFALLGQAVRDAANQNSLPLNPLVATTVDWVILIGPLLVMYGLLGVGVFSTRRPAPERPAARRATALMAVLASGAAWLLLGYLMLNGSLKSDGLLLLAALTLLFNVLLLRFAWATARSAGLVGRVALASFQEMISTSFDNAALTMLAGGSGLSLALMLVLLVVPLITTLSPTNTQSTPPTVMGALVSAFVMNGLFALLLFAAAWAAWVLIALLLRPVESLYNGLVAPDPGEQE